MDREIERIVCSIKELEEKLESKKIKLAIIRRNCNHVWPKRWLEKTKQSYRNMSGAVDSVFSQSAPEIIVVRYKFCKACGKEKIKE